MNKSIKMIGVILMLWTVFSGYALGRPAPPSPAVVSTLDCTDSTRQPVAFVSPVAITADGNGYLYVVDGSSILKITPDKVVSILAGDPDGDTDFIDGKGLEARFHNPAGIVAMKDGNLFVTDTYNNAIRKISPDGVVTTLACSDIQTGSEVVFENPIGITADSDGNLYITDNQTIRKITPDGKVTTVAGSSGKCGSTDGPGLKAQFNSPSGIAVDGSGNLYVADTKNNTVRKITPDKKVATLAGKPGAAGPNDGSGSRARFRFPWGITIDKSDILYVTDAQNHLIRKITPDGVVATLAGKVGKTGSDDGTEARFGFPMDITVGGNGTLYVADNGNYSIRKIVLP